MEQKIYVETLLTPEEWKERYKTYPTSSVEKYPEFFDSDIKWRYRMGLPLTPIEISRYNKRIDQLLTIVNNTTK